MIVGCAVVVDRVVVEGDVLGAAADDREPAVGRMAGVAYSVLTS